MTKPRGSGKKCVLTLQGLQKLENALVLEFQDKPSDQKVADCYVFDRKTVNKIRNPYSSDLVNRSSIEKLFDALELSLTEEDYEQLTPDSKAIRSNRNSASTNLSELNSSENAPLTEAIHQVRINQISISPEVEKEIQRQLMGCEKCNVYFYTSYILLALLQLQESFTVKCLDKVQPRFATKVQESLRRFVIQQSFSKKKEAFKPLDIQQHEIVIRAKEIALAESSQVVDERHVLLALLEQNSETSRTVEKLRSTLGAEKFEQLCKIARSEKPAQTKPKTPIEFDISEEGR